MSAFGAFFSFIVSAILEIVFRLKKVSIDTIMIIVKFIVQYFINVRRLCLIGFCRDAKKTINT